MMLSFLIFVALIVTMVVISYADKAIVERKPMAVIKSKMSLSVRMAWLLLAIVMISLYIFFNGN